jgi:phosphatidylglycerol:prolipoprotein diacylglycerol transferase
MLAYYLHDLDPIIFRIYDNVGPRWYGLAYVLAFISGFVLFLWLAKRGYADLPVAKVGDFITGAALFGVIIGGRLGYVFFYNAARPVVDIARVGRRNVQPRWDDRAVALHLLLRPSP